jgi:hypothetical protein
MTPGNPLHGGLCVKTDHLRTDWHLAVSTGEHLVLMYSPPLHLWQLSQPSGPSLPASTSKDWYREISFGLNMLSKKYKTPFCSGTLARKDE